MSPREPARIADAPRRNVSSDHSYAPAAEVPLP
jgi:hypothetical protein